MRADPRRPFAICLTVLAVCTVGPGRAHGDVCDHLPPDAQAGMIAACESEKLLRGRVDEVERDRRIRALELQLQDLERERAREHSEILDHDAR